MRAFADPPSDASSTVVHRPFGQVDGYRRITDRACRVAVLAFPMTELPRLAAAGLLAAPAAYIISDDTTAYVGESIRPGRRLAEHVADPSKTFARDAILVAGCEGAPFDKGVLLDLQFRLARRIQDVGARTIWGLGPTEIDLSPADIASNDRIFADAARLIFDSGCRFLHGRRQQDAPSAALRTAPAADETDGDDTGPISIGVSTTPVGMVEFELRYDAVWARGYWARDGHFIVTAGSEVRASTNPSCDPHTRARRDDLLAAGVLASIPGVDDRRRLIAAVSFPSASIAAKAVCGAHTAGRWLELDRSAIVVLGGLRQAS